jgi:hypothetical protein
MADPTADSDTLSITPFRREFDTARDPYTARVALGLPGDASLVSTINGETGDLTIDAGDGISITTTPSTITIGNTLVVPAQGRVTLTTNTPVMTAATTAQTTVYYTPYVGQAVPIYDGTNFVMTDTGGELSQASTDTTKSPAAVVASSNYDLFVWDDAGTIRCTRGPAWTSATARGTGAGTSELTRIKGILLNSVAITNGPAANRGTFVGSVRSNGSSTLDWHPGGSASGGTAALLHVWNMYNRCRIAAIVIDSGTNYTYTSSTWRACRGGTGMRVNFLSGLQEDAFHCIWNTLIKTNTSLAECETSIGYDITNGPSTMQIKAIISGTNEYGTGSVNYVNSALGSHFLSGVEKSDGTNACNFNADGLGAVLQFLMPM